MTKSVWRRDRHWPTDGKAGLFRSNWVATTKGIDSNLVGDLMMQTMEYRFGTGKTSAQPIEWLSDNGSC